MQKTKDITSIENAISKELAVLLYFSTQDCGVCNALRPKINELISSSFSKIHQFHIHAPEQPEIAHHFNILSAPQILVYFDGKLFLKENGMLSITEFKKKIERVYNLL